MIKCDEHEALFDAGSSVNRVERNNAFRHHCFHPHDLQSNEGRL